MITYDMVFGHVILETRMRPEGNRLIGEGRRIDVSPDGERSIGEWEPTGAALFWPDERDEKGRPMTYWGGLSRG